MPITNTQKKLAEQHQWDGAKDNAPQIRLVAGPGTGKSKTLEKRVAHILSNGASPDNVYVISFTRATCAELVTRIQAFCSGLSCAAFSKEIHVSTMHSLALRILKRANLLNSYPSTPFILDNWEQSHVYDREFASSIGCAPSRATEIRLARDAQWQTLNLQAGSQTQLTQQEIQGFNAFHAARTNLYSCVLPGEVIYKCVEAIQQGVLQVSQLPKIDHLIVDEYQDLNACDQMFVRLLSANNSVVFIAGDDDQSIYSFRHADPTGIVKFQTTYPSSKTHILTECFRCAPAILDPANRLIQHNPNRIVKSLTALYGSALPPVQGQMIVWSFQTAQDEARAIAQSCQELIKAGMVGKENDIVILISNRRVQLDIITQELGNLGLPYESPPGDSLVNEYEVIRAVYSIIRIIKDNCTGEEDYLAHRDIFEVLSGVGPVTSKNVADACLANNQNFRELFYLSNLPSWLSGRNLAAVQRVIAIIRAINTWNLNDTLAIRSGDIATLLSSQVFITGANATNNLSVWNNFISNIPGGMTLEELFDFFAADSGSDQETILDSVNQRLGLTQSETQEIIQKKIRILTMHGAKGLNGKIVFIPGVEQGIIPNFKALRATGLLIEQRRLFYVSMTRAMACCIISHANQHVGPQALALTQTAIARLTRSQFINEMGLTSVTRSSGLSQGEAATIMLDVNNL